MVVFLPPPSKQGGILKGVLSEANAKSNANHLKGFWRRQGTGRILSAKWNPNWINGWGLRGDILWGYCHSQLSHWASYRKEWLYSWFLSSYVLICWKFFAGHFWQRFPFLIIQIWVQLYRVTGYLCTTSFMLWDKWKYLQILKCNLFIQFLPCPLSSPTRMKCNKCFFLFQVRANTISHRLTKRETLHLRRYDVPYGVYIKLVLPKKWRYS